MWLCCACCSVLAVSKPKGEVTSTTQLIPQAMAVARAQSATSAIVEELSHAWVKNDLASSSRRQAWTNTRQSTISLSSWMRMTIWYANNSHARNITQLTYGLCGNACLVSSAFTFKARSGSLHLSNLRPHCVMQGLDMVNEMLVYTCSNTPDATDPVPDAAPQDAAAAAGDRKLLHSHHHSHHHHHRHHRRSLKQSTAPEVASADPAGWMVSSRPCNRHPTAVVTGQHL